MKYAIYSIIALVVITICNLFSLSTIELGLVGIVLMLGFVAMQLQEIIRRLGEK